MNGALKLYSRMKASALMDLQRSSLCLHSSFVDSLELLQCWSEVYVSFCPLEDWRKILWNNKEICGSNTPIFCKVIYFESGIIFVKDLLLHLNNTDSFRIIGNIKWIKQIFCFGLDSMPQLLKEYQGGLSFV